MTQTRRLAAILAADVAGYSRLIGADEGGTLERLRALRHQLLDPKIAEHRGRLVKTTGDGLLVEFGSVVDALRCAVEVQHEMAGRNTGVPPDSRIDLRIGINMGDIVVEDGDIFGDGVNVAARLEGLAEPGGICVAARVQEDATGKVDLVFDDMGEQALKNITRPVRAYRVVTLDGSASTRASSGPPLPDKPSIAVLPFANMSGDPEQEYFVDGMVEDITTAIARLPWLFVTARNSSFTYKGKAVDVREVARELGVRYVLEGSVRKAANRVRITGQWIDTATGAHIWADRFDGALDDIFELQDQIASRVVGAIEPKLRQSEIERAKRKPTESLDAYDLYLRALAECSKPAREGLDAAIGYLRQALRLDPSYAPAAGLIGYVRREQMTSGVQLLPRELAEALDLARHALAVGRDDPDALRMAGPTLAVLGGEIAAALSALDRATALNPNSAQAWRECGIVNCFANRPDAAIAAAQRAMRLSPLDPLGHNFKWVLGFGLMLAGRYEEAMEWVDRSLHDRPEHHPAIRGKVALCGYLGRAEEARQWIRRLLEANPAMTIAGFKALAKYHAPGTMAVWVEGFRKAGLPEG
jgi:TolB-like protein/class 3 adenylate cyclase/Flp pilus assembly protein TadD